MVMIFLLLGLLWLLLFWRPFKGELEHDADCLLARTLPPTLGDGGICLPRSSSPLVEGGSWGSLQLRVVEMASLDRVRLGSFPWLWERGVVPWSLLKPSVPIERPRSVRDGDDPGGAGCNGGLGRSVGASAERSREWLRVWRATGRVAAPGLSIKCLPSLRLTIRTTSSPERRGAPPTEYRPPPPPPPLEEAVEESLSPDRRRANGNFVSLFLQRRARHK